MVQVQSVGLFESGDMRPTGIPLLQKPYAKKCFTVDQGKYIASPDMCSVIRRRIDGVVIRDIPLADSHLIHPIDPALDQDKHFGKLPREEFAKNRRSH